MDDNELNVRILLRDTTREANENPYNDIDPPVASNDGGEGGEGGGQAYPPHVW